MADQRRFDGIAHTTAWRGLLSPIGVQPYLETPTEDRRSIDTPDGVEKVSSEDTIAAASSLTRWGGAAAVLGACPPLSFLSFSHPSIHPTTGNSTCCVQACFVPNVTPGGDTRPGRGAPDDLRRPRLLYSPRPQQAEGSPWAGFEE